MLTSEQRKKPKQSKIRYTEYYSLQETFDKLYADSKNGKVFNHLIELISSDENIRLADCPKTKKILVKRQRMWYN